VAIFHEDDWDDLINTLVFDEKNSLC